MGKHIKKEHGGKEANDQSKSASTVEKISVPNFRNTPKPKEKPKSSTLTFSHGDEESSEALDSSQRRKTLIRAGAFITTIVFVSFVIYIVLSMILEAQSPKEVETPAKEGAIIMETDDGKVGVASQGNFMIPIARDSGFDLRNIVPDEPKNVGFIGQTITNNFSNMALSFGGGYTIDNANNCTLESGTDFCFVSELKKNDVSVAQIYALSNVFQTKFFTTVENVNQVNIPGFTLAANGQALVSGESKNTLFLTNPDGLTFVVVFDENSAINEVAENISYAPQA